MLPISSYYSQVHLCALNSTAFSQSAATSLSFGASSAYPGVASITIFREVEVNIPQFDYAVDDYAVHYYTVDRYVNDCIVDEHAFNSPSLHDENHFFLSHLNVYSPCTGYESESVVDIASKLELDSCSEGGTHEFDQHAPTVEDKGAYIHNSLKINRHRLNPLINNHFLDPTTEDISLLDQI
ncbi:hypothetical protein LR48_Vigan115s000800 [Vigna angularis]|uniref:Uncharacterized protein n=1 Tax=Phaseolus angularis TaxID=3914 RepID=A0A0L9T4N6_PHAAN|nr:hypothetical protein LR48_Vigan115s000800 [Vigna angularis]